MYCRNCGNIVADDALTCSSCGFNPADGSNYCPKCGHFCIPGDVECVQCKASLVAPAKLSMKVSGVQPQSQPQRPQQPQQSQVQAPTVASPIVTSQPQSQPQAQPQPQAQVQSQPQPQVQSQPQSQPQPQPQSQQRHVETKVGPKFLSNDQRYCRNCGLVIPAQAQKCPFCDAAGGGNYCHKCGSGTTSSDTVCSVCSSPLTIRPNIGYIPSQPPAAQQNSQQYNSAQQNRQQYNSPQQNRQQYGNNYGQYPYNNGKMYGNNEAHDWLTTLLLCIFIGTLGVHRFYTKNYVAGVIQLLTGGMCGIWWLIDVIMIVTDSYTDGNGNKLKHN